MRLRMPLPSASGRRSVSGRRAHASTRGAAAPVVVAAHHLDLVVARGPDLPSRRSRADHVPPTRIQASAMRNRIFMGTCLGLGAPKGRKATVRAPGAIPCTVSARNLLTKEGWGCKAGIPRWSRGGSRWAGCWLPRALPGVDGGQDSAHARHRRRGRRGQGQRRPAGRGARAGAGGQARAPRAIRALAAQSGPCGGSADGALRSPGCGTCRCGKSFGAGSPGGRGPDCRGQLRTDWSSVSGSRFRITFQRRLALPVAGP